MTAALSSLDRLGEVKNGDRWTMVGTDCAGLVGSFQWALRSALRPSRKPVGYCARPARRSASGSRRAAPRRKPGCAGGGGATAGVRAGMCRRPDILAIVLPSAALMDRGDFCPDRWVSDRAGFGLNPMLIGSGGRSQLVCLLQP